MEIKIIETSETKSLDIIDPKNGVNWIDDLMGNHNCSPEDELDDEGCETGYRLMTKEDYDWWADLTSNLQDAEDRYHALINDCDDDMYDEIVSAYQDYTGDLEDNPSHINEVCDHYEKV